MLGVSARIDPATLAAQPLATCRVLVGRAAGEGRLRPVDEHIQLEEQSLRKSLIAAGAAVLAVGGAGVAYAQNAAPTIAVKTSVSPTKAGTKHKPKAEKFTLTVTNNVNESKATASQIKIQFPSTLKLSTKGLPQCTKSDNTLVTQGTKVCKKSIAGSGLSHVILNPYASPTNVTFKVTPIVGKNQMLYYISAPAINTNAVLHGKIHGSTQTIVITSNLQQPVPGLFSAIVDLKTTISLQKGKHSLITSTGCKGGGHTIKVTESFVPNPTPPAATSATATGKASCRK
jgi:hypothetical protein